MDYELKIHGRGGEEGWRNDPSTHKQRACLEFLKLPVPAFKGQASDMLTAAFEKPKYQALRRQWDKEKFSMHPDLYAMEIAEMQRKISSIQRHRNKEAVSIPRVVAWVVVKLASLLLYSGRFISVQIKRTWAFLYMHRKHEYFWMIYPAIFAVVLISLLYVHSLLRAER